MNSWITKMCVKSDNFGLFDWHPGPIPSGPPHWQVIILGNVDGITCVS